MTVSEEASGKDDPIDTSDAVVEEFANFTHSVAAVRVLLGRAHAAGSLIEGLILYAAVVDALLRILLAHATGTRSGTVKQLDPRHFRQDRRFFNNERDVYRAAAEQAVISPDELKELTELYDFRNAVVHRLVISGLTYETIGPQLDRYEVIYSRLLDQLTAIEQPAPPHTAEEVAAMRARVKRKLGGRIEP